MKMIKGEGGEETKRPKGLLRVYAQFTRAANCQSRNHVQDAPSFYLQMRTSHTLTRLDREQSSLGPAVETVGSLDWPCPSELYQYSQILYGKIHTRVTKPALAVGWDTYRRDFEAISALSPAGFTPSAPAPFRAALSFSFSLCKDFLFFCLLLLFFFGGPLLLLCLCQFPHARPYTASSSMLLTALC